MRSASFTIIAALIAASPAQLAAQDTPYFGDDSSEFARDGECDDVRFVGAGMAEHLLTDSIGRDASDCRAAFAENTVMPNPLFPEPAEPGVYNYGDDTSDYARDGECDDIRFAGAESHEAYFIDEDIGHDASDCRAAVEAGKVRWQANAPDMIMGKSAND